MADVIEATAGKIRNKPIEPALKELLKVAAEAAGVDRVVVTSGGQDSRGTPNARRTGSTRHDLGKAADLTLEKGGRTLAFTVAGELPIFEQFVAAAVKEGATGLGAGIEYMGPRTIHVGFGAPSVWGKGGKEIHAPSWLKRAVETGKAMRDGTTAPSPTSGQGAGSDLAPFMVTARSGLKLRGGPGTSFEARAVLPLGTRIFAAIDSGHPEWARVDLQGDGLVDGFVFAGFIAPA